MRADSHKKRSKDARRFVRFRLILRCHPSVFNRKVAKVSNPSEWGIRSSRMRGKVKPLKVQLALMPRNLIYATDENRHASTSNSAMKHRDSPTKMNLIVSLSMSTVGSVLVFFASVASEVSICCICGSLVVVSGAVGSSVGGIDEVVGGAAVVFRVVRGGDMTAFGSTSSGAMLPSHVSPPMRSVQLRLKPSKLILSIDSSFSHSVWVVSCVRLEMRSLMRPLSDSNAVVSRLLSIGFPDSVKFSNCVMLMNISAGNSWMLHSSKFNTLRVDCTRKPFVGDDSSSMGFPLKSSCSKYSSDRKVSGSKLLISFDPR